MRLSPVYIYVWWNISHHVNLMENAILCQYPFPVSRYKRSCIQNCYTSKNDESDAEIERTRGNSCLRYAWDNIRKFHEIGARIIFISNGAEKPTPWINFSLSLRWREREKKKKNSRITISFTLNWIELKARLVNRKFWN